MNIRPPVLDNEPVTPWHWNIAKSYAFNLYTFPFSIDLTVFTMSYLEEMN